MTKGQFSVVVALYEVEKYVEAFLQSLRNQTYSFDDLDIIIVDDGSTDGSMNVVNDWVQRYPDTIRAISKANGGPGSARNLGLTLAKNMWVTFPDPDDMLHPNYFSEVDRFLAKNRDIRIELVTTRLVQHVDGTRSTNHGHPLDWKFKSGNRMVDLDANPDFIHLSGGTAFVRLEHITKGGLRFEEQIRPKFEDANFIGRYIALVEKPLVGVVSTARYFYRKRSDGSSLIQSSWSNPGVYGLVPKLGYLGLLQSVKDVKGYVPRWAQSMVLYELVWAYVEQKNMHSITGSASDEQLAEFLASFDQIMSLIDVPTIMEFAAVGQGWIFHNILLSRASPDHSKTPAVVRWTIDADREVVKYSYVYSGKTPEERIEINGSTVKPLAEKVIAHDFFGREEIFERAFVVPSGELRVLLDGQQAIITSIAPLPKRGAVFPLGRQGASEHRPTSPQPGEEVLGSNISDPGTHELKTITLSPSAHLSSILRKISLYRKIDDKLSIQAMLQQESKRSSATDAAVRVSRRIITKGIYAAQKPKHISDMKNAKSKSTASRYKDAWILIDRKDRADDNAEHLYRYLAESRKDVNSWFVLQRESPDWDRLAAEGFRLLPYGSKEAAEALYYASFNISSHADRDIQYPPHHRRYGASKAKIVFLQHGVTKDDLSRWLNPKKIALMLTATNDEHSSIIGDRTNYKLTSNEVVCTGFPRHDQLRRLTIESKAKNRRNILIAPTWRQYLTGLFESGHSEDQNIAEFENSDFGRNWLELLHDPQLGLLAKENNLRIRFLAHPNLASIAPRLSLPSYIDVLDYSEISVQSELVGAAVVVSDFSSLSFEGAMAGANIIHFQFDGEEIFKGGHVYRKGYFDYESMGLGPRVETVNSTVAEIGRLASRDFKQSEFYEERVASTFAYWDMRNSERATIAIENLSRPWWQQKTLPVASKEI